MQLSRRGHGCGPGHCSPDTQVWTTGASQLAQAQKEPSMCSGDDAIAMVQVLPQRHWEDREVFMESRENSHMEHLSWLLKDK